MLTFVLLATLGADLGRIPDLKLPASNGTLERLPELASATPFTVFTFFARDCPVQRNHDSVLSEIARTFAGRVGFYAVDSETGATPEIDKREAAERHYPFPMLTDDGARFARAVDCRFGTCTIVVDRTGVVRFRGGIDSSRGAPTSETRAYLRDALSALLLGRAVDQSEPKALGCYLRGY